MPLKVVNKSKRETKAMRKLFSACLAEVRKTDNNKNMRNMRVTVTTGRNGAVSGYAYYNSNIIRMRIPPSAPEGLSRRVARVFLHEVGHCLGKKHFRGVTFENCFEPFICGINDERFPLPFMEEKKAVTKADIVTTRFARAVANLHRAESRLKRARTLHKKWADKVKYYEKKMAASKKGGGE